jgi:plastocyanin
MKRRSSAVLACAGVAVLLPAAAAQAKTKSVDMGTPTSAQKTIQQQYGSDANAFFPRTITVAAGDTVRFKPVGFHTVDFPKRGGSPTPLFSPTGQKVSGAVDPAGAPFWFNGQDQLGFSPPLLKASFGKKVAYTGAKDVNSGLPFAQKPKAFSVRFPKAGTYTYFCNVHPGMKGTVRVLAAGRRTPSTAADTKRKNRQVAAALNVAQRLATTTTAPAGTVSVGLSGGGGVERFAFVPGNLTVPVGTTVNFAMSARSREAHTATTGPGDPQQATTFLGTLSSAFDKPVIDPAAAAYPSDVPGTLAGLTPTLHGNGFWNSGVLDATPASPLPPSNSVRFDAPGTYNFYCLIHPFMHGTVTVQ